MANITRTDEGLRELALFAGAGGGILGGTLLGFRTVCAVEIEGYAASVLLARQNDGCLPPFPVWDDICTFDGLPWRGVVDIVSGGFPCQDISAAGKGAGIEGERSGLWREMARVVCEVGPKAVLVENSPMLTSRGLGSVLGDLASLGYDAEWGVLGADDAGAPHIRKRIWIVANANQKHGDNGRHGAGEVFGIGQTAPDVSRGEVAHAPQHGREPWGADNSAQESERRKPDRGGINAHVADSSRILEGRSEQRPERQRIGRGGESIDAANPDSKQAGRIAEPRSQCGFWESEPDVG
jgi:DNA (cytosine-5)-methyltransferase 1